MEQEGSADEGSGGVPPQGRASPSSSGASWAQHGPSAQGAAFSGGAEDADVQGPQPAIYYEQSAGRSASWLAGLVNAGRTFCTRVAANAAAMADFDVASSTLCTTPVMVRSSCFCCCFLSLQRGSRLLWHVW